MKRTHDAALNDNSEERDAKITRLPSLSSLLHDTFATNTLFDPAPSQYYFEQPNSMHTQQSMHTNTLNSLDNFYSPATQIIHQQTLNYAQVSYEPPQQYIQDRKQPETLINSEQDHVELRQSMTRVSKNVTMKPIKQLAYDLGLSKDPGKNWRYRDVKRSLFDKLSTDQQQYIESNMEHAVLTQRLPNKLTMSGFAKRISLLAFHFTLRDGKEPRWYKNVNVDIMNTSMTENEPALFASLDLNIASRAHDLIEKGSTIVDALQRAQQ
jgi:hypothetical protein